MDNIESTIATGSAIKGAFNTLADLATLTESTLQEGWIYGIRSTNDVYVYSNSTTSYDYQPAGWTGGFIHFLNVSDVTNIVATETAARIAADNLKVDKVAGKGLSTNDYTTAEKNLLATVPSINIVAPVIGQTIMWDGTKWTNVQIKTINNNGILGTGNINIQGLPQNSKVFSTSGTFTVPDGVSIIIFNGCNGGGGGGGGGVAGATNRYGGAGGGGGSCYFNSSPSFLNVTPGQVLTILIGAGGAGGVRSSSTVGTSPGGNGGNGGVSSIDSVFIFTTGGGGGGGGSGGNGTNSSGKTGGTGGTGGNSGGIGGTGGGATVSVGNKGTSATQTYGISNVATGGVGTSTTTAATGGTGGISIEPAIPNGSNGEGSYTTYIGGAGGAGSNGAIVIYW